MRSCPSFATGGARNAAYTRSGLPDADIRVIAESEIDYNIAIDISEGAIPRHGRFLEMLLEAVADTGERDG